ncbi:MAG: NAD(P)/FAD-dependent oxidoreductase [Myxococcales bacterium]|nr:NAD(P)/FAD-dependent oxidoreductase [Myxococcales bacterium]
MDADVVVVGGGVVGLAAAAALARTARSVLLLERNADLAREITSRNSEVIHAGIYYPEGSLKAALCVAGREALYARCEALGIPHRKLGKLIVATEPGDLETLEGLQQRGTANGVPGLALVDGREVARREPCVRARAGLVSPETGIVDAAALSLSYAAEAEAHGAVIVRRTEVVGIELRGGVYRVATRGPGDERSTVECGSLVNAAGLASDAVAERAGFDVDARGYRLHPCKGDYFALVSGTPVRVSGLVYPVPSGAGLGVHATLDLGGRIRFGPDAEYVDRIHYRVDPGKATAFASAVRRYLPELRAEWLTPDTAGVRPKLAAPGEAFRDFVVAEESEAGWPGFVNLIGIESPGLTAAPAIAQRVVALLTGRA